MGEVRRQMADDFLSMSVPELTGLMRTGTASSAEIVEAHIRRIEAVNPQLNAMVWPLFDLARAEAQAADKVRARGEELGPLHGVPVTIKECYDVVGTPTTNGIPTRATHRAERDCFPVARLRKAGAILLGKTNVPQLLLDIESDNPLYGRVNHPADVGRTPGGSSGGEAALIAAGGSPLGLAGDIGGSIRIPSHFCGICGLKPTSHRLPRAIDESLMPGMEGIIDQTGILGRTVADVQLGMAVLAAPGLEAGDPATPPVKWRDPGSVDVKGLRIGFYVDDGHTSPSPAIRRAVREAAAALADLGCHVVEMIPPDGGEAQRIFLGLMGGDRGAWAKHVLQGNSRDPRIAALLATGMIPGSVRRGLAALMDLAGQKGTARTFRSLGDGSAASYWRAVDDRNRFKARFMSVMDGGPLDAVLCPPFAVPALTHGASQFLNTQGSYATTYNILGLPAGVVPVARIRAGEESDRPPSGDLVVKALRKTEAGSAGLPVGVQVAARYWREDVALAVMAALEERFRQQPPSGR